MWVDNGVFLFNNIIRVSHLANLGVAQLGGGLEIGPRAWVINYISAFPQALLT